MPQKHSMKAIFCCFSLWLLSASACSKTVAPSWEFVSAKLLNNAKSISSIDMNFLKETYNSAVVKQQFLDANTGGNFKDTVPNSEKSLLNPLMTTPDNVSSFHWHAGQVRWLCERTTLYPRNTGPLITDWARYNGELMYLYNDFTQHGLVKPSDNAPGFYGVVNSNPHIGLPKYIEALCGALRNDVPVSFLKAEIINGVQCFTYEGIRTERKKGQGRFSRVKISVDPNKNFRLVKLVDVTLLPDTENKTTSNGSAMIYSAKKWDEVSKDIFLPTISKIETYRIYQGKSKWRTTEIVSVDNVSINTDFPNKVFERTFPPGIPIMNRIISPQTIVFIGGKWHKSVKNVANGKHPKLEMPDGTSVDIPKFIQH